MRLAFFLLTILCVSSISAQDIEVKKFEPLEKDQTAALSPRKDINGVTCGLVKVLLKEPGAEFEGNVMGDVQFTGNEYLVYLPNGTKRLGIKHPNYLPTTIVFADYGTKKIASSITYELKLKANKKHAKVDNGKKGMAVFNIKPSNAILLIDGQIADGSGGAYALSLPYGPHYYTVKLKDFNINNQIFAVSKDINTINVDLTTFFSRVIISSVNNDSKVYVNDEFVSNGRWEGFLPPSTYNIELRKDGCHPQSKVIELYENDSVCVSFPKMNVIGGKIKVDFKPDNSEVYIDGRLIGKTPLEIDGVSEGHHMVEIRCENYESSIHEIHMLVDQSQLLDGQLQLTDLGYLITRANNDDVECQWKLGNLYMDRGYGVFERKDLVVNSFHQCPRLERNIDKAIYWHKKAAISKRDPNIPYNYPDWSKEALSECYFLKGDFNESFYWAGKCRYNLMLTILYYYGLGVPQDKQKCAHYLLKNEWSIKRLNLDAERIRKCEASNIDDLYLRESIEKLFNFEQKQEIWNIVKEME
jgi:hypothetical protein